MGAYASSKLDVMCPFMIEASATICALQLAQQMGFLKVEIEGDALGVIRKLQSTGEDLLPVGCLVDEAKAISRRFQLCKFMHTGRKGNMAAHYLAKYGLELYEERIWVEECPDFVMDVVINDVLHLA
ncbi:hypothetical protein CRYUN_Cryun17cG0135400 [Craigia yunnanensis]